MIKKTMVTGLALVMFSGVGLGQQVPEQCQHLLLKNKLNYDNYITQNDDGSYKFGPTADDENRNESIMYIFSLSQDKKTLFF